MTRKLHCIWLPPLLICMAFHASANNDLVERVNIDYELFRLDNGLTTIVYTDHSTPTIFVGIWYAVGSKDEPDDKTGFAHLFEHLMFQGTENREGEYFTPFTKAGATGMNGTTSEDRTNYFATVPTGAIDMALWMESDRMSHLLGAVTQEALDEQRGVVQNEKRQGENRPYSGMYDRIRAGVYPAGHPYRHSVIGSMEDLDAASLEDVHEWFNTYYGASNAVLVLAGDINIETAREKVTHYFSGAPAGVPLVKPQQWIPEIRENRKEIMYDGVGLVWITRTWALPNLNDRDTTLMYLVNETMVNNKNAPLQKVLVDELQLATDVSGGAFGQVIASENNVTINLKNGVRADEVISIVDDLIAAYLKDGPDEQILENAKLSVNMYMLGSMESKSTIGRMLAEGQLYSNDPLHVKKEIAWINEAIADELRDAANRWLNRGYFEITVLPFPEYLSGEDAVDRSAVPSVTDVSGVEFPDIQMATLENGIELVVASSGDLPLVDVAIRIGTGNMADSPDAPGISDAVFALMDKGTDKYDAHELAAAKDKIGMEARLSANVENSSFSYRILTAYLQDSLDITAEILQKPTLPEDELVKFQQQVVSYLSNVQRNPTPNATSLFRRALYGADHPLGGVWTPDLVENLNRERIVEFHIREIAPDNITIFMIGDVDLDTAVSAVEASFGEWGAVHRSQRQAIGKASGPAPRVILVDNPDAPQSTIRVGHAIGPHDAEGNAELSVVNGVFGADFEARINMNLREDKSWSYGMGSGILSNTSGDQALAVFGSVQTDKTMESMQEVMREYEEYVSTRPATPSELERVKLNRIRSLPGRFATKRGFLTSMISSDSFGLPFDYAET
ncbi:MAG: pitrilysin family protein, partial [Pseudomonadota bacterium]|nr:pitrilysin family protein [Pseudomonadota bacterium]